MRNLISLSVLGCMAIACKPSSFNKVDEYPEIFPDYVGVMVPQSMTDLRFEMADGRKCKVSRTMEEDVITYKVSAWEKGSKVGTTYKEFPVYISHDEIDPYIAYRLIEPGYESWHDMGIYQRELGSFKESAIVSNKVNDMGCVNCHTFPSGNPESMVFHARGKNGGTVFIREDSPVKKINLATVGPQRQGTYTAWNPDGRHLVFSSNTTNQSFHVAAQQPLEVYDKASDIIMMDLKTEEITVPVQTDSTLETFPAWSEDGKTLYFCSAEIAGKLPFDRAKFRYRLMALDFDESKFTGEPRTVLDVDSLSISFPRAKNGKILFTASAYGTFPIWHKEADLWIYDTQSGDLRRVDEVNSDDTESYHSWSSNGKWIVFSSRRIDGRYTRLFISHYNEDGTFSKPFLLPQRNPKENTLRLKSYNIPEFVKGKVEVSQSEISKLFR